MEDEICTRNRHEAKDWQISDSKWTCGQDWPSSYAVQRQVWANLVSLWENKAKINTAITVACEKAHEGKLLECNGGHVSLAKQRVKTWWCAWCLFRRHTSARAKVSIPDLDHIMAQFMSDVKVLVEVEEMPCELVVDQTGIHYVLVSSWTIAKEGLKQGEVAGIDYKRQITAVFPGTGVFLPPQLWYPGKTAVCLLSVDFPLNW